MTMSSFIMTSSTSSGIPSDIFIFSENSNFASISPNFESLFVTLNDNYYFSWSSLRSNMIIV